MNEQKQDFSSEENQTHHKKDCNRCKKMVDLVPFESNGKHYEYSKYWKRVRKMGNTNIGQKLKKSAKGISFVESGKKVYLPENIAKIFNASKT